MSAGTLVVGLGSAHGDDQIGWRVAEDLAALSIPVRIARSPSELLDWLGGVERLVVCDACQNLGAPGDVLRLPWPDARLAALRSSGSHDMGLAEVLALAEQLGHLPKAVIIWCAQGEKRLPGSSLSPTGCAAVGRLVNEICRELEDGLPSPST